MMTTPIDSFEDLVSVTADQVISRIAARAQARERQNVPEPIPIPERLQYQERIKRHQLEDRYAGHMTGRLWWSTMVLVGCLALYGIWSLIGTAYNLPEIRPLQHATASAIPARLVSDDDRQPHYRLHCTVNDRKSGLEQRWLHDVQYRLPDGTRIDVCLWAWLPYRQHPTTP